MRSPTRAGARAGRLRVLAASSALPLLLTGCGPVASAARTAGSPGTAPPGAGSAPAGFALPGPSGPLHVGTTELHLVDHGRRDPWVPERTRELMVSVYYPAERTSGPRAAYLPPGVARTLDEKGALGLLKPGQVDWAGARTHSAESAPADLRSGAGSGSRVSARGARPVVLYSPGWGVPRLLGTTAAEDLASRGYVVVTIDHTYETAPVEFPGGRVEPQRLPEVSPQVIRTGIAARVQDSRFVLDRLAALRGGANPDAEGRALPRGLGRALDLSRVGMFGHSAGGIQAAEAMRLDRRVDAGIDMDGTLQYGEGDLVQAAREGLDRPFMLMGAAPDGTPQTHVTSPSWASLWDRSTGWKRDLNVPDGAHYSFTDLQAFLPGLARHLDLPAGDVRGFIGTVDPERMVSAQRAYVGAFFDRHLRDRPARLLDRPSPRHPDVRFIG